MKRLIVILLAGSLLLSCMGCITCASRVRYANAKEYTPGDFTYDASAVTMVDIDWIAGSVTLKNGSGTLSVSESGAGSLQDADRLHWWIDGTTLRIRYCRSGRSTAGIRGSDKELTVELPASVDLKLGIASGKVVAPETLVLGKLDLNKASGSAEFRNLIAGEIDVDTASGGLTADAVTAKKIDVNSASGNVEMGLSAAESVKFDVASGNVTLRLLDADAGAMVRHSAVSGSFNCKLPYEKGGKTYQIGRGEISVSVDAVSGSVTIE